MMTDEERNESYFDAIKQMTPRERRFWFCYLEDLNASNAYRKLKGVPCKDSTAWSGGSKMLKRVKEKIGEQNLLDAFNLGVERLYHELDQRLKAKVTKFWQEVDLGEFEDNSTRMRATELLADILGLRKGNLNLNVGGQDGNELKITLHTENGSD